MKRQLDALHIGWFWAALASLVADVLAGVLWLVGWTVAGLVFLVVAVVLSVSALVRSLLHWRVTRPRRRQRGRSE